MMYGILWWYDISKVECGKIKKPEKAVIMKKIIDGVREPPLYEKWSTENETELVELKKKKIDMGGTRQFRRGKWRHRLML